MKMRGAGVSGKQTASVQMRASDRWFWGWLELLEPESDLDSGLAYELAARLTSSFEGEEAAAERSEALGAGRMGCQGRMACRAEAEAQSQDLNSWP